MIVAIFFTGCIPEDKSIIELENGARIEINIYNKSTMHINAKTREIIIGYSEFTFRLPFEIITSEEKEKKCAVHEYQSTYDNPKVISAKEIVNGETIYYWLVPVENVDGSKVSYWFSLDVNLAEQGMKDYMFGIEDKDGIQSDDISWRVTAHMVTD